MWAAGAPLSKMISQAMRRWPLFFFLPPYSSHITTRRRSHTTLTQYTITKAFISILRRETCRRLSLSCKSPLGGARSGVPSSSAQPIENFKLHEDQSPFGSERNCFEADPAISDFALSKSIGPDPRTVSFVCRLQTTTNLRLGFQIPADRVPEITLILQHRRMAIFPAIGTSTFRASRTEHPTHLGNLATQHLLLLDQTHILRISETLNGTF